MLSDKGRIEGSVRCYDAVINGTVSGDLGGMSVYGAAGEFIDGVRAYSSDVKLAMDGSLNVSGGGTGMGRELARQLAAEVVRGHLAPPAQDRWGAVGVVSPATAPSGMWTHPGRFLVS